MPMVFVIPAGEDSERNWESLGALFLPCGEESPRWACHLAIPSELKEQEWSSYFIKHSVEAGLSLPLAIKDSLFWFNPTTPFAWWFAAWWRFGNPGRNPIPLNIKTVFDRPFEQSARAIQRFEVLGIFGEQDNGDLTPHWDNESGNLSFKGQLIRKVSRQGKNIRLILDSFQELSWPIRIDDPLPDGRNPERLSEALRALNIDLKQISFHGDGSAAGIEWRIKKT